MAELTRKVAIEIAQGKGIGNYTNYAATWDTIYTGRFHRDIMAQHGFAQNDLDIIDAGGLTGGTKENPVIYLDGSSDFFPTENPEATRPNTVELIKELVKGHQPPIPVIIRTFKRERKQT